MERSPSAPALSIPSPRFLPSHDRRSSRTRPLPRLSVATRVRQPSFPRTHSDLSQHPAHRRLRILPSVWSSGSKSSTRALASTRATLVAFSAPTSRRKRVSRKAAKGSAQFIHHLAQLVLIGDVLQTGLGLSLVRQIVSLSGGRLGVKSLAGEGTMMWVELPYGIGTAARESVNELDFSQGEKLAKVLSTPDSGGVDDQVEFDFLSTPPLLRKQSLRPLHSSPNAFGSRERGDLRRPLNSQSIPGPYAPSDIVLTLPPSSTASTGGSYFDARPITSRPSEATTPATLSRRPSLVRAPTMQALNFERGPVRNLADPCVHYSLPRPNGSF